jgi:predicted RNA-binding protein with RPS1 domain
MWVISTVVFKFYLLYFARYDILYGNLSSIIIMLVWCYFLSYIFVLGMAINASQREEQEFLEETKKLALALKDINNDPWEIISKEVGLDDIVTGKVVRIIEKGAIVELREGVQAFLPISELSEERVMKVTSVVNIGDEVSAMIIEFKPKNRRMVLSIKEANREPEEDYSEFLEVEESLGSLGDLFKDKFKNLQK